MDNQHEQEQSQPENFVSAWIKSSFDFWQIWAKNVAGVPQSEEKGSQGTAQQSTSGSYAAFLEMSRSMNAALIESGVLNSCLTDMGKHPEISMKFAQLFFDHVFKQLQESMAGFQGSGPFSADKKDEDLFASLRQTYAQGLEKMFHLPQLGMTRAYQERMNEALDRFNQLCVAAARFVSLLNGPVERSWIELHNTVARMSEGEDGYPDNPEEYYKLWIKLMEGDYMKMFKTEEFVDAFHQVVNQYSDFQGAQQKVLADAFQFLPVANKEELDEVAKENYFLKKEVKKLAKRVKELEKSSAA